MVPIAHCGLGHLCYQRLGVAQEQMHHRTEAREFLLKQLRLEADAIAGTLHDSVAGRRLTTHEQRYPEHALVADDSDFRGRTVFHDVEQGNDRRGRKIDMPQMTTRFVEHLAQRHRDQFEV